MAQLHHSAGVQISAEIRPVKTCAVGQEVLWPLVRGQELHWRVVDVNEDGIIAMPMREDIKDILIVCAERYVAVVVDKRDTAQEQMYKQMRNAYNSSSTTNTFTSSFGTGGMWTFQ